MPNLKLLWTRLSEPQFADLRRRATETGHVEEFIRIHNEIVVSLRDLDRALECGEPLYDTRTPGGEVRQWIHEFISVVYLVFRKEQVAWILRYQAVPASWPD